MKKNFNKSLAKMGESAAKIRTLAFCLGGICHEPKMPESLREWQSEKKYGKDS